jgi:hypothetical protein
MRVYCSPELESRDTRKVIARSLLGFTSTGHILLLLFSGLLVLIHICRPVALCGLYSASQH